jgi:hypothetical protein
MKQSARRLPVLEKGRMKSLLENAARRSEPGF